MAPKPNESLIPGEPLDNLTAVLHGIEDLRLENQSIPDIEDDRKFKIISLLSENINSSF